jgi:endonuclease YncB( thermonuclease family)
MKLRLTLAGLMLLAVSSCSAAGSEQPTRIVTVVDGDTVVLSSGAHVRLVQIDAPEVRPEECFGVEAGALLRRLAPPGSTVRLESDSRLDKVDQYGRLLRYVFRGATNLNLELVRRGAATPWFYHRDRGRYAEVLLEAARAAQAARRGLWGACPRARLDPYHAASTGPPK